jgi:hypothetical protein
MKRFMNKKVAAIGLAAGLALGAAGAAFAYFNTTATGNGTAATGSATALTITQTNAVTGLVPGGPAGTIALSIHNTAATAQTVGPITVTVTSVTSGSLSTADSLGNVPETCVVGMYSTTPSAVVGTIAAGGTATTSATVQLNDDTKNQDNCQAANGGGALTLHFSA